MRIIVLNDGETYTNAEGCMMVEIEDPDDGDEFYDFSFDTAIRYLNSQYHSPTPTAIKTVEGKERVATVIARF